MDPLENARAALNDAKALLITAGAGMGVDSGLPDFRGTEGFWRAYPPFKDLGLAFEDLADPRWFGQDPALAWGFYGHRLSLYRTTSPHRGFELLREAGTRLPGGVFAFTSNVDGQFERAGFPATSVHEVHGSIHHLQCTQSYCDSGIWDAAEVPVVDGTTYRATAPWPECPRCGDVARPNILMFGDAAWRSERSQLQGQRLSSWLGDIRRIRDGRLVVVEVGAGKAISTVRQRSEWLMRTEGATLIRINPRESDGPPGTIAIASGALEALLALLPA